MNGLIAGALSIGVLGLTSRIAARHAQVLNNDLSGNASEFAQLFALRENIEDYPLLLESKPFSGARATSSLRNEEKELRKMNFTFKKPILQTQ